MSGATRGLGLGLVKNLSSRPNTIVFAGARDPSIADELNALVAKSKEKLHVVKLVSGSEEDAKAAAKIVQEKTGKLDVLIANAGTPPLTRSGRVLNVEPKLTHSHGADDLVHLQLSVIISSQLLALPSPSLGIASKSTRLVPSSCSKRSHRPSSKVRRRSLLEFRLSQVG